MTFTYKFFKTDKKASKNDEGVTKIENGKTWFIPENTENVMWQEYQEWLAEGNTTEAADSESLSWDDIRSLRNDILRDTDWTMTTGATVDQAQWAAYRQNLRDLPQTYKDKTPDDVVWPTQPSTAGPNS